MIEKELFNDYVEKFKKLTTNKKKEITISELKKTVAFLTLLQERFGVPKNIIYNREINDVNGEIITEDDFIEAVLVYSYIIQEGMAEYVDKTMNIMEE